MLDSIKIPSELLINSPKVRQAGYENTAELIFELIQKRLKLSSFVNKDILDIGCGTRFTMALINRHVPIKSYTGIEINKAIVDFFQANVMPHDGRFAYHHWNVYNEMYNEKGKKMQDFFELPVGGDFDIIWLFSVFTHLNPSDASALLTLMRNKIRPGGNLFFTAHTNPSVENFIDKIPEKPLLRAFYNPDYLCSLIEAADWRVESFHPKDGEHFVKSHFVCSPAQ